MAEVTVKKPDTSSTVIGWLSFIPLIGVPIGLISILLGLIRIRNGGGKLILLGTCGILFTIAVYGSLFYEGFMVRGGMYDKLRAKLAQTTINDLVKSVEYYKVTKGHYPEDLHTLDIGDAHGSSFVTIEDPSIVPDILHNQDAKMPIFYYELTEDKTHYYLLGVGVDQKPFTADDILPQLSEADRTHTGLLIKNPAN